MELRPYSMYFNKKDIYEDFKILLKEEIHIPPNTEEKETKEVTSYAGVVQVIKKPYKHGHKKQCCRVCVFLELLSFYYEKSGSKH